jgi:hypothetical protein
LKLFHAGGGHRLIRASLATAGVRQRRVAHCYSRGGWEKLEGAKMIFRARLD